MLAIVSALLICCKKDDVKVDLVSACSESETSDYQFVVEVTEFEGQIITLPKQFPADSFFILADSPIAANANRRLPLAACNLPNQYKVEGLKIVFSARMLWYKHADNISIDVSTQPIELIGIRRYSTQN